MEKKINSTADITLEELEQLKAQGVRIITVGDGKHNRYPIDKFITIKAAISDYVKHAPHPDPSDPDAQKKVFSYIYTKMAHTVKYDETACRYSNLTGYAKDMTEDYVAAASNLENALLCGSAICAGYAETLRNLLAECGINSKVISGGQVHRGDPGNGSHAWNQVQLDGEWYHCDITNDADFILEGLAAPHFLKSTKDCTRVEKYPPKPGVTLEETGKSIGDDKQYELIEESRTIVTDEMEARRVEAAKIAAKNAEAEKRSKRPRFVNAILDMLEKLKGKEKGDE